jgi:toxin CptA
VQFPVIIGLHRSFLLDRLVFVVALSATVFIGLYPRSPWLLSGLLVLLWLLAGQAWRRLSLPYAALRLNHDGSIEGRRQGCTEFQPLLCLPGATVHPWLTVLHLQPEGGGATQVLPLTVDSTGADEFRRLRVFLRWQMRFSVSNDAA